MTRPPFGRALGALGLLAAVASATPVANRAASQAVAPSQAAAGTPVFPLRLRIGRPAVRGEPSLFLGPEPAAPSIGYVSKDAVVELEGPPQQGRARVRVRGGMRVRAYVPVERLVAHVVRRGRVRDTPVYVDATTDVTVLDVYADGRARVQVDVPQPEGNALRFVGTFPVAGLGAEPAARNPDVLAPGTPAELSPGRPFHVFDAPGGVPLATFHRPVPCLDLGVEGGLHHVLVGSGPYLNGYVDFAPTWPVNTVGGVASAAPAPTPARDTLPRRIAVAGSYPLVRLRAGTRVVHGDTTVAILDVEGYGRLIERMDATGEADVFVAVDDQVTVRGIVPTSALVEGAR